MPSTSRFRIQQAEIDGPAAAPTTRHLDAVRSDA
jgi:hypothetical protein